jgi:hypothetical protein
MKERTREEQAEWWLCELERLSLGEMCVARHKRAVFVVIRVQQKHWGNIR